MYRVLERNPDLGGHANDIDLRMSLYHATRGRLLSRGQSLSDFANAHAYYGFHPGDGGWYYREWAPAARALYLMGDFNNWQKTAHPLHPTGDGNWEIFLPGEGALWDGCRVKTVTDTGTAAGLTEHIPLYIRRAVQDEESKIFCGVVTDERRTYPWRDTGFVPAARDSLYIYEAHVGMAGEEGRVSTYREFADNILPYIKECGYTAVQLMAIMEHPYYGSFGYQVSNFYAASSRFGTPDDLKYLVDTAHTLGLTVLLDLVHSHAVKNTAEGINLFDGTVHQFFHAGEKGEHPAWGTKCFDYGKTGVLHFLLSNLKFWLEEYHFDGFRFDGVTSMLYHDHGLGTDFNTADKYFSLNTHTEAVTYLQLANDLIREVKPNAITVAEDMSAMPGMCLPVDEGGVGFDFRLGMGLPDMWIRTLKEKKDEDWDLYTMWGGMCLRRPGEGTVAYVESHDQALVGDKTLMFRMADAAMYTDMDKACHNTVIDRAVALHKMTRLFTLLGGGDAYLTFMGNEFGHPEWIDFPREGNNWGYHYCRRQWSLRKNPFLKYEWLGDFDREMLRVAREARLFSQSMPDLSYLDNTGKILVARRAGLLFAFNFSPTESREHLLVPVPNPGEYTLALSTDDPAFGGFGNIAAIAYPTKEFDGRRYVELYLPARTAAVFYERVIWPSEPKKPKRTRKKF